MFAQRIALRIKKATGLCGSIIEKNRAWNDDAARTQVLKIFEAAGFASDVAKIGRRRLSKILFS